MKEPESIRKRAVQFYAELYRSEYKENEEISAKFYDGLPNIAQDNVVKLDGSLTEQELLNALKDMKTGKAPGIDGLSVEFYKAFWGVMGKDLLDV